MKMTFQPKNVPERKFMDSEQEWPQQVEEKFLQQEEQRKKSIISIGHIYVAIFFYANLCKSGE